MGGWEKASIDPTAGVRLVAPRRYCPRCGVDKGPKHSTRAGLCSSCIRTMTRAEARVWAA